MVKFVILDDGHGMDTIGKCSPIFERQTKIGDIIFDPQQRFKENMFTQNVVDIISKKLTIQGIPSILLTPEIKDISLGERKLRQNEIYKKYKKEGFSIITISIHANALGSGNNWNDVYGVETFYKNGCEKSLKLAQLIQTSVIKERLNFKPFNFQKTDRGVKTENFYIFREFMGTTVLFESEFMTNIDSLKLLCSDSYRDKVSDAIVDSVLRF